MHGAVEPGSREGRLRAIAQQIKDSVQAREEDRGRQRVLVVKEESEDNGEHDDDGHFRSVVALCASG